MPDALRVSFELSVVQDLMYAAIHCAEKATFASCRRVLLHFCSQKRYRGVDEMLNRLYEPILWRSLSAANAEVRLQALLLWTDAFPLHDPDAIVQASCLPIDAVAVLVLTLSCRTRTRVCSSSSMRWFVSSRTRMFESDVRPSSVCVVYSTPSGSSCRCS